MAIDQHELQDLICQRGPFMWHVTRASSVAAIEAGGLRPGSELGISSKEGFLKTRACHVYVCNPHTLAIVEVDGPRAYLQIDLSKLNPALIDPDEDKVQRSFEIPDGGWVAVAPPTRDKNDAASGPSLAEWAEATDGFDAPDVTAKSLNAGLVSYRGTLQPRRSHGSRFRASRRRSSTMRSAQALEPHAMAASQRRPNSGSTRRRSHA